MSIARLQRYLKSEGVSCAVLFNLDPSVFYFTGIELEKCILVISTDSAAIVVSELEAERTQKFSRVKKVLSYSSSKERDSHLRPLLGKKIAISKDKITVFEQEFLKQLSPSSEFVDCTDAVSSIRMVKEDFEIELLKKSCKLADSIIQKCISSWNFKTEQEVKTFLDAQVLGKGLKNSFETIVASGKNASMPHYFGSTRLLGGFCVIDFGVKYKGYCSDITRTVYLGRPTEKEKQLYNAVLSSQIAAIDSAREGIVAGELDAVARGHLGEHSKAFIHGLGHHIGVEVHDSGFRISSGSKGVLKQGMAITIEPGIYYAGKLGIRIEDDVLVTSGSPSLLTRTRKELISVRA